MRGRKEPLHAFLIPCKLICKSLLKVHWGAEGSVEWGKTVKVPIRWLGLSSMHKMKRNKTVAMRILIIITIRKSCHNNVMFR